MYQHHCSKELCFTLNYLVYKSAACGIRTIIWSAFTLLTVLVIRPGVAIVEANLPIENYMYVTRMFT